MVNQPDPGSEGLSESLLKGLQLPAAVYALLRDVLSKANSFDAAMSVIDQVRQAMLGDGLLTVNKVSALAAGTDAFELQRLWSSNVQAYAVSGLKRKTLTPWSRQLLLRHEVFVGEGDAVLAAAFDDHARIKALGLHSIVNVPLLIDGRCAATLNVLGSQLKWLARDVALIELLGMLARPWVLPGLRKQIKRKDNSNRFSPTREIISH